MIRMKVYEPAHLEGAPAGFRSKDFRAKDLPGHKLTIQVSPDDCTGCGVCVNVCPARSKTEMKRRAIDMAHAAERRDAERVNWQFFDTIPPLARDLLPRGTVKGSQVLEPLFEFSGACAGCGETPYVKLVTQLFGDRIVIANSTGCSSIYGGNLPTTPWTVDRDGRGPAWNNSLFEDTAEFGMGMRLGSRRDRAGPGCSSSASPPGSTTSSSREILEPSGHRGPAAPSSARGSPSSRARWRDAGDDPDVRHLLALADDLVAKGVWIIGGDGWAYDIGFGGLDHVLASGRNVNILVLDTEVYSNTGGQASKATPRGAVAKFAASGKATAEEGPRRAGDGLRHRLRRPDRPRGQRHPGDQGAPRGRRLAGAVAGDRLQHLHRPRHGHVQVDGAPAGRGPQRLLAAVPLPAHARPPTASPSRSTRASRRMPVRGLRRRRRRGSPS